MGTEALHDLTAAYALDALDGDERREYEAHLAGCARCRDELATFSDAASSLAYAAAGPIPSPNLRERILSSARAEGSNVVPLRPRWAVPAAVTAVAAVAAVVALAIWATSLSRTVDRTEAQRDNSAYVAALAAVPGTRQIAIGDRGSLVIGRDHMAALILRNLPVARRGMLYEAWVADQGTPKPAGTFEVSGPITPVPLTRDVPIGAVVMVTEEHHRVDLPTSSPLIRVPT